MCVAALPPRLRSEILLPFLLKRGLQWLRGPPVQPLFVRMGREASGRVLGPRGSLLGEEAVGLTSTWAGGTLLFYLSQGTSGVFEIKGRGEGAHITQPGLRKWAGCRAHVEGEGHGQQSAEVVSACPVVLPSPCTASPPGVPSLPSCPPA